MYEIQKYQFWRYLRCKKLQIGVSLMHLRREFVWMSRLEDRMHISAGFLVKFVRRSTTYMLAINIFVERKAGTVS